ncbi:MAG: hypothetical protein N2385_08675 [Chloroflexus sp.]|nr:hypothetical protein [Chloroflexus sp.]
MSESVTTRSDRVNIDEAVISTYHELTGRSDEVSEQKPFRTLKDVFMLAVVLGYRRGIRLPAPSSTKHTIRREVFTESDYQLLKAIAVATTGDINVLLNHGEILTIAEEYAQAGIREVKAELLDQGGRPLWNLVDSLRG